MSKVSVVIPHFNHWDLTHALLYSLYSLERKQIDEVLLVDDCSTDEMVLGGERWWKNNGMLPVRLLRSEENQGFLLSANHGLICAHGDIKVLLSNDIVLYTPFIGQIRELLENDPNQLIGNVYYPLSTGWNTFGDRTFPYLSGHLLAATADTWDDLGYFDERFTPNDFEDVDISTKALQLGLRLTSLNLQGIVHLGGQSIKYSPEREAITRRNQKQFEEKWVRN